MVQLEDTEPCFWNHSAQDGPHCITPRSHLTEQLRITPDLEACEKLLNALFGKKRPKK